MVSNKFFYGDSILHCYDQAIFFPINTVPPTLTGCLYHFFSFLSSLTYLFSNALNKNRLNFESVVLWQSDGLLFHAVIKSQLRAAHVRLWYQSINRRVICFPAATTWNSSSVLLSGTLWWSCTASLFLLTQDKLASLICNHSLCPIPCFHCKHTPYALSSVLSLAIHLLPLFFFFFYNPILSLQAHVFIQGHKLVLQIHNLPSVKIFRSAFRSCAASTAAKKRGIFSPSSLKKIINTIPTSF